jgi:hypothetical protein
MSLVPDLQSRANRDSKLTRSVVPPIRVPAATFEPRQAGPPAIVPIPARGLRATAQGAKKSSITTSRFPIDAYFCVPIPGPSIRPARSSLLPVALRERVVFWRVREKV